MPVEFEWQVTDHEQRETIAQTERHRLPRWLRWSWRIALAVLALSTLATYGTMRWRYERARREAATQIRDVISLEARASERGDADLFMRQQDRSAAEWYAHQRLRVTPDCLSGPPCPDSRYPGLCPDEGLPEVWRSSVLASVCAPFAPATVEHVDLQGDVAWVEVVEGEASVRRARFYRRTAQGWKHTQPWGAFWGDVVQARGDTVTVSYHRRDQPHIEPLLERISQVADEVDGMLRYWPAPGRLHVTFAIDASALQAPYLETGGSLILASPWLSGIPVDGTWDEAVLDDLDYWTAYSLLASRMRYTADDRAIAPVQWAMVSEFAAWYVSRDPAQAPVLGRIIERHGAEALPRVFLSLRGARLVSLFLIRWLSLHPQDPAFFEALLNIERDAVLAGQKQTFLLLQDREWASLQATYFDKAQVESPYTETSIRVHDIDISGDQVRARLSTVPLALHDQPPQTLDSYAFFCMRDWDWRRAPTTYAVLWGMTPLPTRVPLAAPRAAPTPAPD